MESMYTPLPPVIKCDHLAYSPPPPVLIMRYLNSPLPPRVTLNKKSLKISALLKLIKSEVTNYKTNRHTQVWNDFQTSAKFTNVDWSIWFNPADIILSQLWKDGLRRKPLWHVQDVLLTYLILFPKLGTLSQKGGIMTSNVNQGIQICFTKLKL